MTIWHGDEQKRMRAEDRIQTAITALFDGIEEFAQNDAETNEPIYNGGSFGMAKLDALFCAALETHATKHGKIRASLMMRMMSYLDLPKAHELANAYYDEGQTK